MQDTFHIYLPPSLLSYLLMICFPPSPISAFVKISSPEMTISNLWLVEGFFFFFYYFCGKMAFHRSSKDLETNLGKRGLPWWFRWQSICLQRRRPGFDPWVGKIPWRRKWQPTPVFLPGKSHGRRSLIGYRPWGAKSQTWLHFHFLSLSREKIQSWGGWSTHKLELWHVCLWGSPDALGGLGEGEMVEVLLPRGEEGKGILRERKTRDGA